MGAELFHAGGRTETHDEGKSRFSQFRESSYYWFFYSTHTHTDTHAHARFRPSDFTAVKSGNFAYVSRHPYTFHTSPLSL